MISITQLLWVIYKSILKKNVPWHILAPRAVACDSLHLRASAHLWHVSAFLCNREFFGISCYIKNRPRLFNSLQPPARFPRRNVRKCNVQVSRKAGFFQFKKAPQAVLPMLSECASKNSFYICIVIPARKDSSPGTRSRSPPWLSMIFRTEESPIP